MIEYISKEDAIKQFEITLAAFKLAEERFDKFYHSERGSKYQRTLQLFDHDARRAHSNCRYHLEHEDLPKTNTDARWRPVADLQLYTEVLNMIMDLVEGLS